MKGYSIIILWAVALTGMVWLPDKGATPQAVVTITIEQAARVARLEVPGDVIAAELVQTDGASIWQVTIRAHGTDRQVRVEAERGVVLTDVPPEL